ncbi:uncharacterized protein [Amphiura filiformis]|uniref:uncharacterized protein n=1 Tax=Amphiura filiformis TaxID=82378 RepID=UPI003B222E40
MKIKMLRNKVLESILLILLFVYLTKVLIVMLYMEPGTQQNSFNSLMDRDRRNSDVIRQLSHKTVAPDVEDKVTENPFVVEGALNSDLFREVLQPKYSQDHQCRNDDVFLVALIGSTSSAFDVRMAIRETWANVPDAEALGVQTMFVIGLPDDESVQTSVFQENERYEDILQGNFLDTVRNSTIKYLMGLKWVTNRCSGAKFVFWGDDNLFANYERIVKQLRGFKTGYDKYLWHGKIVQKSRAVRDSNSRYYVSYEQFKGEFYHPFCTGDAGYVLSMNAVQQLYNESWHQVLIPFPDAYTGVIAKQNKWTIVDNDLFTWKNFKGDACELRKVITSRGFPNVDSIYYSWKNLENTTFLRDCPSPDLDLVLMNINASNEEYLDKTLRLLYDHPGACYNSLGQPEKLFMVVLISTLPRHFESRDAIRKTWGQQTEISGEKVKFVFIMGLTQRDTIEIQQKVLEEDKLYGDIIQARFTESFQNLTLKVIMGLKWVTEHCAHAKYMYKGDDDMFVNFHNIIRYIKDLSAKGQMSKSILGSVLYRSVRVRRKESKYYVSDDVYRGRYFPPYCSGGGYIISTDIIPDMYEHSLTTPFIPIDDAYQGILADKVGAKPIYHAGFKNWGEKSDTCSLHNPGLMTIHGFKKPELMFEVWRNYTDVTVTCDSVK